MSKSKLSLVTAAPAAPIEHDELVPDPQVARECGGVTLMTLWRWTNDRKLNFPAAIKIKKRNYRSRRQLEQFKQALLRQAIAVRAGGGEAA